MNLTGMWDDPGEIPEVKEEVEDEYVEEAKPVLAEFFRERELDVFYLKQLQVLHERRFFHWITARALYALVEEGTIGTELALSTSGTTARMFYRPAHRFRRRRITSILGVIDEMSNPEVAEAAGEQADLLFFNALASRGFVGKGADVRVHRGKEWTTTGHDLDFVIEKDGIEYGSEVKNRWDYIGREEMRIKLAMCKFFGVKPLFIMRASPKSYNKEIIDAGGYALIFEAHIYPFGMRNLVRRIREELGLIADSPRAIPSGIIDRFMKWHSRQA